MVLKDITPGYYWIKVRTSTEVKYVIGGWNGRQLLTIRPYYELLEIGEKIPANDQLKLLTSASK